MVSLESNNPWKGTNRIGPIRCNERGSRQSASANDTLYAYSRAEENREFNRLIAEYGEDSAAGLFAFYRFDEFYDETDEWN
jgi:hypothetical protein